MLPFGFGFGPWTLISFICDAKLFIWTTDTERAAHAEGEGHTDRQSDGHTQDIQCWGRDWGSSPPGQAIWQNSISSSDHNNRGKLGRLLASRIVFNEVRMFSLGLLLLGQLDCCCRLISIRHNGPFNLEQVYTKLNKLDNDNAWPGKGATQALVECRTIAEEEFMFCFCCCCSPPRKPLRDFKIYLLCKFGAQLIAIMDH